MSVFARRMLLHPQWLVIAMTLAVAWFLYQPRDALLCPDVHCPDVQTSGHPRTNVDDGLMPDCLEGDCDGTYVIAPSDVHLAPPLARAAEIASSSDEDSIYGDATFASDPFQVNEIQQPEANVVPVQYIESPAATGEVNSPVSSSHAGCEGPVRLPALGEGCRGGGMESFHVKASALTAQALPRTCSLTDRRSGIPVATLKIAAEIRSETLNLDTYEHLPNKWSIMDVQALDSEPDWNEGRQCPEAHSADLVMYESPTIATEAPAEIPPEVVPVCESTLAILQTIEQSQGWIQSGHIEEAIDLLTNALFEYPGDVNLLQHIAVAYLTKHDHTSALSAVEQCLAIDRHNADTHEIMSHVLLALGQVNRSRHYADQALFLRRSQPATGQGQ